MPRPHGGRLVDRVLTGKKLLAVKSEVKELQKIAASNEKIRDIENIAFGIYSPLEGFLGSEDYHSILYRKRLSNNLAWTIPILFDVSIDFGNSIDVGDTIVIVNREGEAIALMTVEEKFRFDRKEYSQQVFNTQNLDHPGVKKAANMKEWLIGGKINLINIAEDPFSRFRLKPHETRVLFREKGWKTTAGFQTRNAPHLGHEYVQKIALAFIDGVFINPVIGKKKKGDFKNEVILEAYTTLIDNYYLSNRTVLAILETEMRYAGPREAVFHATIRKNFGCTHFIIGRDHAGVGSFYKPYEAQEIFNEFPDLEITPIFFKAFFYCTKCGGVESERICPHNKKYRKEFSGTRIREMLKKRQNPPKELMRPEVTKTILLWDNPFIED